MNDTLKFIEHVEQSILDRKLFMREEGIVVAVSGGVDSMVLLNVLARLAATQQWRLTVAHFNHQLRGHSSDADERLVRHTAEKFGLPFVSGRGNVKKFARKNKLSLEMAARKLRHEFLARVAGKRKIRKIALAHHADDQVELFFVRLLRGAGGEGLAGMRWIGPSPVSGKIHSALLLSRETTGKPGQQKISAGSARDYACPTMSQINAAVKILLARPLLDIPKSALTAYAKSERILFREDATNAHLDIQRNRIRHELLPLLTKKYQPALSRVVLRQMEILGVEAEWLTASAQAWLEAKRRPAFTKLDRALQRRVLQVKLTEIGQPANFDLIEQLRATDRPVSVAQGVTIRRDKAGRIAISKIAIPDFESASVVAHLVGNQGKIEFSGAKISWNLERISHGIFNAPKKRVNFESLDADKVGVHVVLRHWQRGDRFQPLGMPGPVKLQDLFTNQKISRLERHDLVVGTTKSGEIFWVEGLRLGEAFKLDKNTRNQLNWRWKRV